MENCKIDLEQNIHHFWLDHLEVYGRFMDESLFNKLDFDNSHEWTLHEFTISKHEVPKYKYKIIFKKDSNTLFAYYKWIRKIPGVQPIATKDYLVIYSTAFRLMEYEELLYFLDYYLDCTHCRRFDICMDIKININELLSEYFEEHKTGREYKKSWEIQTRYYWEVYNSKNKRQIIRVYNKLNDTLEKWKIELYSDYFNLWDVTRIELEIRPELAKVKSYTEVFDDNMLLQIFKNYLKRHTSIFESLPWENETLYRDSKKYRFIHWEKIEIDSEDYQGIYYRTKKKNIFLWHARGVYNLWFCPVRILIDEWYIQTKTKRILWEDLVEHLWLMESKLKRIDRIDRKRRKDFQNLLDNSSEYEGEW